MVKTVEDLRFRDEGYKLHGFNALASRNLGYNRIIPDTRNKLYVLDCTSIFTKVRYIYLFR